MKTLMLGAAGAALADKAPGLTAWANIEDTPERPPTFAGKHVAKPLPYPVSRYKGFEDILITNHHTKNYGGTVTKLNKIEEQLATLNKSTPAFARGSLKREQIIAANSLILHEHYFENLGGDGKATGKIVDQLKLNWGSVESWQEEFTETGAALAGGSGWVVLSYSLHDGVLHNFWQSDHSVNYALGRPLLVMDMYEHAYQHQFGPNAAEYIKTFIENVNWDIVNKRLEQAESIKLI